MVRLMPRENEKMKRTAQALTHSYTWAITLSLFLFIYKWPMY